MLHRFAYYYCKPIVALTILLQAASCSCNPNATKSSNKPQDPPTPPPSISLQLSCWKDQIEGQEPLQLKIDNNDKSSTQADGLQLIITRTAGAHASIVDAQNLGAGKYELKLDPINSQQSISRDFTILGGDEKTATFTIQLIYLGQLVGKPVEITWKRGFAVALREVKYDKDTGNITGTLENIGTKAVRKVQVKCISKTSGIKFNGKELKKDQEIEVTNIAELPFNEKHENHSFGKIEFGTNPIANLEFTVMYEGGKMEPISHTFTAKDIQLSLAINYDAVQEEVSYTVKNAGTGKATKVELAYQNTSYSWNPEEQKVLLNNLTNGKVDLGSIAAEPDPMLQTFSIDFQGQAKARFTFKVICEGVELPQLSQEKEFKAPQIKLQLEATTGSNKHALYLYDTASNVQQEAKIIIKDQGSSDVNLDQLKITITPTIATAKGYLSLTAEGSPVTELVGAQCNLGNELALHICPKGDEKLEFKLQLYYKENPIGNALPISWKAHPIELKFKLVEPVVQETDLQNVIQLREDIRSIKLQITSQLASGQAVDMKQVQLRIQRTIGKTGFLAKPLTGNELLLTGDELGSMNQDIALLLDPQGDKQLAFKLTLTYQGKPQHIPIHLSWDTANLKLEGSDYLTGENIGKLQIRRISNSPVDFKDFTVEISSKKASFILLNEDANSLGSSASAIQFEHHVKVQFKVQADHGQMKEDVMILIKRGTTVLAQKIVKWESKKMAVEVSVKLNGYYIHNNQLATFCLVNLSQADVLNKDITFQLTNPKHLTVKLAGHKGTEIITTSDQAFTLDEFAPSNTLGQDSSDSSIFSLYVKEHPATTREAELKFTFRDSQGNLFYSKTLNWIAPSIVEENGFIKKEAETLHYEKLENYLYAYSHPIDADAQQKSWEAIMKMQTKAKEVKQRAEELAKTVEPLTLVNSSFKNYLHDLQVSMEDRFIQKIEDFKKEIGLS